MVREQLRQRVVRRPLDQLDAAAALCARHRDVRVCIDHLGKPRKLCGDGGASDECKLREWRSMQSMQKQNRAQAQQLLLHAEREPEAEEKAAPSTIEWHETALVADAAALEDGPSGYRLRHRQAAAAPTLSVVAPAPAAPATASTADALAASASLDAPAASTAAAAEIDAVSHA